MRLIPANAGTIHTKTLIAKRKKPEKITNNNKKQKKKNKKTSPLPSGVVGNIPSGCWKYIYTQWVVGNIPNGWFSGWLENIPGGGGSEPLRANAASKLAKVNIP